MLYTYLNSPVGKLFLARNGEGLTALEFSAGPEDGWKKNEAAFKEVIRQLESYFAGELREFDLPLKPEGTPFQREAWKEGGTFTSSLQSIMMPSRR